jgi:hypothetical protein
MERNDYRDGFESFLQEKADEYNLYPSESVWTAIQQKLHTPKKWPYFVVTLVFLGLGIFTSIVEPSNNQLAFRSPQALKKLSETVYYKRNSTILPASNFVAKTPIITLKSKKYTSQELIVKQPSETVTNSSTNTQESKWNNITAIKLNDNHSITEIADFSVVEPLPTRKMETIDATTFNEDEEISQSNSEVATTQNSMDSLEENKLDLNKPAMLSSVLIQPHQSKKSKINWQIYVSPTVSYRNLSGSGTSTSSFMTQSLTLGSTNLNNVNNVVNHKPALGMELGAALVFNLTNKFRFRTGLQFNYNQYDIQAYNFTPELAPLSAGGLGHTEIKAISVHRNNNGISQTWLQNLHAMLAIPIGIEYTILGNQYLSLNIASSIQPTYILKHEAYMLSTNLNNYAKENSLNRNFNLNASSEVFISMQKAGFKWSFGPQFRYQLLSSYKKEYPIVEHLKDFGFKIGMSKTLQ